MLRKTAGILFVFAFFMGVGCGSEDTKTPAPVASATVFTVTFNAQGGSAVTAQTITSGGFVAEPAAQTRSYNVFGGWFKEAACTNVWTFATDTVTADLTLYAKWTQKSWTDYSGSPQIIATYAGGIPSTYATGSFSDVKGTAGGDVYVAGYFEKFQGQNIRSVAKLSGSSWTGIGGTTLDVNSQVNALCLSGSDIYIGGDFGYVVVSGNPVSNYGPKSFAKLSSGSWVSAGVIEPYTAGWSASVRDVLSDASGNIYAAGNFKSAGGTTAYSIAKLSGATWSAVGASGTYPGFVYYDGANYQPANMGGGSYQKGLHFDESGKLYIAPNSGMLNRVDGAVYSYDGNTAGYERLIRWTGSAWEGVIDVPGTPGVDVYADYRVHYRTDGTSYLSRIIPPWGTGGNHSNVQVSSVANPVETDWGSANLIIGPDGTAYVYGSFIKARWRTSEYNSYTTLNAGYLLVWKDGSLQAFNSAPAGISGVKKMFFMPSGDIWIIASVTGADDSKLFMMKK